PLPQPCFQGPLVRFLLHLDQIGQLQHFVDPRVTPPHASAVPDHFACQECSPPRYPIGASSRQKKKTGQFYRIFPPETVYLFMLTNRGAAYSRTGMEMFWKEKRTQYTHTLVGIL